MMNRILFALIICSVAASSNVMIDGSEYAVVRIPEERAPLLLVKRRRRSLSTDSDSRTTSRHFNTAPDENENSKPIKKRERKERENNISMVSSYLNNPKRKRRDNFAPQNYINEEFESLLDASKTSFNSPFSPVAIDETEEISRDGLIKGFANNEDDEDFDLAPFLEMEKIEFNSEKVFSFALNAALEESALEKEEEFYSDNELESDWDNENVEFFRLANEERGTENLYSPNSLASLNFSPQNFSSSTPLTILTSPSMIRSSPLRASPFPDSASPFFSAGGITRSPTSGNLAALKRSESPEFKNDDDNEDEEGYDSELERAFSGFGFFVDFKEGK